MVEKATRVWDRLWLELHRTRGIWKQRKDQIIGQREEERHQPALWESLVHHNVTNILHVTIDQYILCLILTTILFHKKLPKNLLINIVVCSSFQITRHFPDSLGLWYWADVMLCIKPNTKNLLFLNIVHIRSCLLISSKLRFVFVDNNISKFKSYITLRYFILVVGCNASVASCSVICYRNRVTIIWRTETSFPAPVQFLPEEIEVHLKERITLNPELPQLALEETSNNTRSWVKIKKNSFVDQMLSEFAKL